MKKPESFLKDKYWRDSGFRKAVEHTTQRMKAREERDASDEPLAGIENYLKRFTDIVDRKDEKDRSRGTESLKWLLHKKYIIKPENISNAYIKGVLFGNFAEEKGYTQADLRNPNIKESLFKQFLVETGQSYETYVIADEDRDRIKEASIKDQGARLDSWLNYLTSDEAKNYPAAYRYWAFAEMLKLGAYDDERQAYNKRTEVTAAPFPELDPQALAMVLDEIARKQGGEPSQVILTETKAQEEFKKRLKSENFGKLYAFMQEHLKTLRLPVERLLITEGEWRVFFKNSYPSVLVESLKGFHTQWCIAAEGTAASYLAQSDLHIYFSQDENGANSIPRACIVYSATSGVTEVRGIVSDDVAKQHLDDYITPIVSDRLSVIPGGEKWQSKMDDMKRLARIHIKHREREALTVEDLYFLYEIGGLIQNTGYDKDPRIIEILSERDAKDDLSVVLNISREEISITETEALSGDIKYHYGNLDLNQLTSARDLTLPRSVGGNLELGNLTLAEGLKLPDSISGDLDLRSLTSARGLKLPDSIGGSVYFGSLTSAQGLKLPDSIGGSVYFGSLTSAQGLKLPDSIGGYLYFGRLTSAEGLHLPNSIGGHLDLGSLTSAEGLKLPDSIGGRLDLRRLTSAEGLKLPDSIGGSIYLGGLTSAEGLQLPHSIHGYLDLGGLTSVEGLKLPNSIGGHLDLRSLTSARGLKLPDSISGDIDLRSLILVEGLTFPDSIGGNLDLRSLISTEGFKLPNSIGGHLDLRSLTSARGLNLPDSIGGDIDLRSLISAEGLKLPDVIVGRLDLRSLASAEGLKLPNFTGGSIYLGGLTSAKGLKLPDSVGGDLDLKSLISAEGLKLPDSIGGHLYLRGLILAEDLKLPNSIGGRIYFGRLAPVEEAKLRRKFSDLSYKMI